MAIGQRLERVEDTPLLTGAGTFLDDIDRLDALEAAFVRSPVAHGIIRSVGVEEARRMEGVEAIFTAAELDLPDIPIPSSNPSVRPPDQPVLARDRVRFAGEPIAIVVARSRYLAEDAAEAVAVEIEPLEALVTAERALEPDAPEIHPGSSNLTVDFSRIEGDPERAFAEADVVVEREIRSPRHSAMPIEARAVLAEQVDGVLHLHTSSQAPHKTRQLLSEAFGAEPGAVRVIVPDVGGGFGVKAHTYPEELAVPAAAIRLGRAVKWVEDRTENFGSSAHAREQAHRVRMAACADGQILALDVEMLCDQGAYGAYPHGVSLEALTTSGMLTGPYAIRNFRLRCRTALTNKAPEGAYRGVGFVVSAFVHERMVDVLAAELGIDRVELRRRNLVAPDQFPYTSITGQTYDNGEYELALDTAAAMIGYEDGGAAAAPSRSQAGTDARGGGAAEGGGSEDAPSRVRHGIGVATYVEPTGMNSAVFKGRGMIGIAGYDGAHVELGPGGDATVWTTTPAIGQGTDTTMSQVAAEFLGLEPGRIRVARADTGHGDLHGTGSFASRSAVSAAGAVKGACLSLRDRLLEDAADRLEAAADDLEISDGAVRVKGSPAPAVEIAELVDGAAAGRYAVSETYDPPRTAYPYATHACLVSVDCETGQVVIEKYVVAEDCGTIINPVIADGQVVGAVAQGVGGALYEAHDYDEDGQLRTSSLMDYLVPTASEIPPVEVRHLEIPSPATWGGVKGVGEGGTIGSGPAVVNAVCDAIGCELNHFPVAPEEILAAVRSSGSGRTPTS